jgi:predicted HicB family RNase H-like nuclease
MFLMNIHIDDALHRQLKIVAVTQGKKLKDFIAKLLEQGLRKCVKA